MEILMMKKIMEGNELIAKKVEKYLKDNKVMAVNIMASPGGGKTSVILSLIEKLKGKINLAVIEGDIASSIDAEKVENEGVPAIQINTGGACHLDANMINEALNILSIKNGIVFIENVGNLICPRAFYLGEDIRLVIASVPEGHDKTYKYTTMFEYADLVVLNKTDLADYIGFDFAQFEKGLTKINQDAPLFKVSCKNKNGIDDVLEFLLTKYNELFGDKK